MGCQVSYVGTVLSNHPTPSSWFLNISTLIKLCRSRNFSPGRPNSDLVYGPLNLVFWVFCFSSTCCRILFWFSLPYAALTLTLRVYSSFQDLGLCLCRIRPHTLMAQGFRERNSIFVLSQCSHKISILERD